MKEFAIPGDAKLAHDVMNRENTMQSSSYGGNTEYGQVHLHHHRPFSLSKSFCDQSVDSFSQKGDNGDDPGCSLHCEKNL
jgi:hypothetical protein